jgi:hypothetical protein
VAWRKKTLSGKLWTAEGIGHSRQEDDPKYKNGMVQGGQLQEIRDQDNVVQETQKRLTFGKRRKGPEWNSGIKDRGLRQQANEELRCKMAAASQDQEDIRWIQQEGFRTGVCEASSWDVQWVAANQEVESMEESAPSEVEKEASLM